MKQSIKTIALVLFASISAFLTSCDNDETSSPMVQLKFNTINSTKSIPTGRVTTNSLTFTEGYIKIREIQFEAETDTDSVEVNIEQTVVIDFATGATTPDLSGLTFPMGTYEEVEVEIELLDENNQPSVVIDGTFVDRNEVSHAIRFEFNSGETFEVEKEGRIVFGESETVLAQVTFDPGVWFLGVTSEHLEAATKNSSDVIVISTTQNVNIFEIVADGLDLATEVEISK
ncbi:hypothetical protein QQ008_15385 [Fulvivirgaceae bacterium BMA10]|uniref:DUF4382 domain-containing protein n=1 Tax=Splendidivirga corallicola TaxID=3051826 RepID=A0ABT8KPV1_9BACT|nr:hypothetical protein [Fulvivirgaceae bacterium BMA10]